MSQPLRGSTTVASSVGTGVYAKCDRQAVMHVYIHRQNRQNRQTDRQASRTTVTLQLTAPMRAVTYSWPRQFFCYALVSQNVDNTGPVWASFIALVHGAGQMEKNTSPKI